MKVGLGVLLIVPVVFTVGLALGAEAPPKTTVYAVTEGRDAAGNRPVLMVQGKGLKALRFFSLTPSAGGDSIPPELVATGKSALVLGIAGDTEPGSYTLTMADKEGRMLEIPVQIGNGGPIPGTVKSGSLDPVLRSDLDDAETLGGNGPAFFTDAGNLSGGTVDPARFSAYADLAAEERIGTGADQVAAGDHGHPEYLTKTEAETTYQPRALVGVKVYRATTFALPNETYTAIPWDAEEFDTLGFHEGVDSPERLTCTATGYYTVGARLIFQSNLQYDTVRIRKNGTPVLYLNGNGPVLSQGLDIDHVGSTVLYLTQGDYLDIEGRTANGPGVNLRTGAAEAQFWMYRVGE